MWRCARWLLALVLLLPSGVLALAATPRLDATPAPVASPLFLVENAGQSAPGARFQARLGEATLWLAEDALWVTVIRPKCGVRSAECDVPGAGCEVRSAECDVPRVRAALGGPLRRWDAARHAAEANPRAVGVNLKLTFEGANPHPALVAEGRRATRVSYLRGSDPAGWRPNVPVWSSVRYQELYPGIDLVVTGGARGWQTVLEARAGADLSRVRLRVEGAQALALDGDAVQVQTAAGAYRLPLLAVRGEAPGASPVVDGATVRAPFATPGASAPLGRVVPLMGTHDLVYSTFLGGSGQDAKPALAMDTLGATYITGDIASPDFPTTPGAFDPIWNGGYRDAVVAKLSPDGAELAYATYLGGTHDDRGYDIAVDASGAAYVIGPTYSSDFPLTSGAFNTTFENVSTVFVTKLTPDGGALAYSTFLGGGCTPDLNHQCGLALDSTGHAYVVGSTMSANFPVTPGAFQTTCACDEHSQGFVTKLNTTGTGLEYSTFLGGQGTDWVGRVVVDATGAAYVTGLTSSYDFPTTPGAFDTSYNGGELDAFATKLAPDGSALEYSTYLGGSQAECVYQDCAVAIDSTGAAYVTGNTQSSDFPTTPGAFDPVFQGGGPYNTDAFVTKLTSDGAALVYSTFLGGDDWDEGIDIRVDAVGHAFVVGLTWSPDFPTTPDAYDPLYHFGSAAAYITALNPSGADLLYSTYLGGSSLNIAYDLALDTAGAIRVVGATLSTDFPTTPGAFSRTNSGDRDFFVAKLAPHMRVQVLLPLAGLGAGAP